MAPTQSPSLLKKAINLSLRYKNIMTIIIFTIFTMINFTDDSSYTWAVFFTEQLHLSWFKISSYMHMKNDMQYC